MSKDTGGPAFPADIPRINTVTPVASLSPASVTLDAIRRIVREEIRANAALEAAARQALKAWDNPVGAKDFCVAMDALRAALAQQAVGETAYDQAADMAVLHGTKVREA